MNPCVYENWLTPSRSESLPHVSSIRRNLRPFSSNDLKQAYQHWEGFESESDHVKNVQIVSAGKVLDQIRTLFHENLCKKQLDLEASWVFASDCIGTNYLYVEYDLEEDSWSVRIESHIYDYFFNGYRKTLSFKTDQEVFSWLQTHPPKSVSDSIFELMGPVVFAVQKCRTGIDLELNL